MNTNGAEDGKGTITIGQLRYMMQASAWLSLLV